MNLFSIIVDLRLRDIIDIIFLTIVAYHLYLWFRQTKAFKVLVGLLVLGIIYTAARTWGLFLTTWAFQILWQVLIILLIILFQSEIRQVLERVNPLQRMGFQKISRLEKWIPGFTEAIFSLAKRKVGALVILERLDKVQEFIAEGQYLEGEPGLELLVSIFQNKSLLHDGAVLIRRGRVKRAACYLPLSSDEGLPKQWGTRHRAALGLSERCDACVVIVSEETGKVSLAIDNEIIHVENAEGLSRLVMEVLTPETPVDSNWWKRIRFSAVNQWRVKVSTLFLVSAVWLMLAGQQDFEITVKAPLRVTAIPPHLEIIEPVDPGIEIKVRGLRKDVGILNEDNVTVDIDLSLSRLGRRTFSITRSQIRLPSDRIQVLDINPTKLKFKFKEKPGNGKE